ncbi:hypothetical protein ABZP36_016118, partial [Zizania latifolia]
ICRSVASHPSFPFSLVPSAQINNPLSLALSFSLPRGLCALSPLRFAGAASFLLSQLKMNFVHGQGTENNFVCGKGFYAASYFLNKYLGTLKTIWMIGWTSNWKAIWMMINLEGNQLEGPIPPELGNIISLER